MRECHTVSDRPAFSFITTVPFWVRGVNFLIASKLLTERQEWEGMEGGNFWVALVTRKPRVCGCQEGLVRGNEAYLREKSAGRWHFDLSHMVHCESERTVPRELFLLKQCPPTPLPPSLSPPPPPPPPHTLHLRPPGTSVSCSCPRFLEPPLI